jgi:hypothetical protein
MTTESSEQASKKMPWTESVPLYIAAALVAAVVLFLVGGALFADTDATMRRKILGKWQTYGKADGPVEVVFTEDGEAAGTDGFMDLRFTWAINNGEIALQLKGGGDWLSSTAAGLLKMFSSRPSSAAMPIRFEGYSVMYVGGEKFVRLGRGNE